MVHSECWCASALLDANLSANSLPANTHNGQRPLANMPLDFENQDRWCQRSQHWPTGYALPLWAVDTKYPLPVISTRGVVNGANRSVCLRSGDCLFSVKETTSSTEYLRRREYIGDSRTTTPQPHRRSTGSLENRPPVEEHDQTIILRLCLQRNARVVFHAWFDCIRGSKHLHPLRWDHASAPETRARVLVTLGTLEQVLGFVVWDCIDHGTRPHLVERIVTNRSTFDTAVIQRDMEEPRHRTLRPAGSRNRCQQRSAHGVILPLLIRRKCCLMMDTSQPFLPNQLHHSGWPRGPNEQTRCHATTTEAVQQSPRHP